MHGVEKLQQVMKDLLRQVPEDKQMDCVTFQRGEKNAVIAERTERG